MLIPSGNPGALVARILLDKAGITTPAVDSVRIEPWPIEELETEPWSASRFMWGTGGRPEWTDIFGGVGGAFGCGLVGWIAFKVCVFMCNTLR